MKTNEQDCANKTLFTKRAWPEAGMAPADPCHVGWGRKGGIIQRGLALAFSSGESPVKDLTLALTSRASVLVIKWEQ